MTKQELLEMAKKLQAEAEAMPDESGESASTTVAESGDMAGADSGDVKGAETPSDKIEKDTGEKPLNKDPKTDESAPQGLTPNNELEEAKQIEPQTNGKVTDSVKPGVDVAFEQSTTATETAGVEQVLSANFDQRFATFTTELTNLKVEMDKMKVALSEILTRIELVQEVTDKVTTVDHDTLLSESIKLLI